MKFNVAVIALIGQASAIHLGYAESEGPTKADYGEADDTVLARDDRETSGWVNPLVPPPDDVVVAPLAVGQTSTSGSSYNM